MAGKTRGHRHSRGERAQASRNQDARAWSPWRGVLVVAAAACGQRAADGSPDPDLVPERSALSATLLVPRGSAWRYLDDGSDQGTAWRATAFADAAC